MILLLAQHFDDILQIVVFATFFGVALAAVGTRGRPLVDLLDAVNQGELGEAEPHRDAG